MQLTIKYHTEKPVVTIDVTEVAPGLCGGRNPAYGTYGLRKWAVFHAPSATIVRGTKTLRAARELAGRLAPICDWTKPARCLEIDDLQAAHEIAKQY